MFLFAVASVFSRSAMLSFAVFLSIVCFIHCFYAATLIMCLCSVELCMIYQSFGAPRLDNFSFLASWLRVHSSSVCFSVALLYRNK